MELKGREAMAGFDQNDPNVVLYRLVQLEDKVQQILGMVTAIREQIAKTAELEKDVGSLTQQCRDCQTRIRELENLKEQSKGAGVAARAIWAVIGGVIMVAVLEVFRHITSK